MLPTFTSHNRVISEPLRVEWTRELKCDQPTQAGGLCSYYKYKRTRTKKWSYVGMSEEAARICCAHFNTLLNRKVKPQYWSPSHQDATGTIGQWCWRGSSVNGYGSAFDRVVAGEARPMHVDAHLYSVDIDLKEVLSYCGKATSMQQGATGITPEQWIAILDPLRWTAFEEHPEWPFGEFAGGNVRTPFANDFDCDEFDSDAFAIFSVYRDPEDSSRIFVNANYDAVGCGENPNGIVLRYSLSADGDEFEYVAENLGGAWFRMTTAAKKIYARRGDVSTPKFIIGG